MVNFTGKFVLAPMVRIGELPTRLLALKYGADLVWGPEIIDKKILRLKRVLNTELNTIDFVEENPATKKRPASVKVGFRTHRPSEEGKLIFQMGTSDPELAVKAANVIIKDVDGIDINAGCPKHFSVHSGMGAALLRTPDLLCEILTRLVHEVGQPNSKPISVKIRILENKEDTLKLVDRLLETGISNLSVHCRTRDMRNRESPIREYLPFIIPKCKLKNVSFIINGGINSRKEYGELQGTYGQDIGCMVAGAAELNPSVFKEQPLPWIQVVKEFIKVSGEFENNLSNSKFCLTKIIPGKDTLHQQICKLKTQKELNEIVETISQNGLLSDRRLSQSNKETIKSNNEVNIKKRNTHEPNESSNKKLKVELQHGGAQTTQISQ